MQFWTLRETTDWLETQNFVCSPDGPYLDDSWIEEFFDLPLSSREQARLSRAILDRVQPFRGCILSLTETTLCDEDEDPLIIDRIRLSYGETLSILESPTFVFDATEKVEAAVLVRLFIMFCWDGYLLSAGLDHLTRLYGHEGGGFSYVKRP